ncbi:MAG: hypothetical protein IKK82_02850 [Kiritimatiellae bacterium]|nr:hypothetical protein [Kiritimatiellia bacterium]
MIGPLSPANKVSDPDPSRSLALHGSPFYNTPGNDARSQGNGAADYLLPQMRIGAEIFLFVGEASLLNFTSAQDVYDAYDAQDKFLLEICLVRSALLKKPRNLLQNPRAELSPQGFANARLKHFQPAAYCNIHERSFRYWS